MLFNCKTFRNVEDLVAGNRLSDNSDSRNSGVPSRNAFKMASICRISTCRQSEHIAELVLQATSGILPGGLQGEGELQRHQLLE